METTQQSGGHKELIIAVIVIAVFALVVGYVVFKPEVFEDKGLDYALVIHPFDHYRVEKLIVVDPVENVDLFELHDGDVINVRELPNNQMTIRAEVSPSTVSVRFDYNEVEKWRVDNLTPFSASYELYGNFDLLPILLGENTISVTPYSVRNAKGDAGKSRNVTFTIVDVDPNAVVEEIVAEEEVVLEAEASVILE
jgi:hypothetical protein